MDYISNQEAQIKEMLEVIGVQSIDELFRDIPQKLKVLAPKEDDGLSEFEAIRMMESLAKNNHYHQFDNYLGGGAYEHHIPAIVNAITSKSEFLTSYTPYQPEASQGMLQIIFEFQSAICALTGMDVANASLYDGASSCAEAILMALRINKGRRKILMMRSVHPHYQEVVKQYLTSQDAEIVIVPFDRNGCINQEGLTKNLDDQTAAVFLQYPNFLGVVEDLKWVSAAAKKMGALTVISANPLVYGLYADAKELGADIAVGDCQPLGLSLNYGGPYAGYIACRQEFVRQMPGRIVGETLDTEKRRGFVLTLQAREQHIRREKATSNICTNQALAALASLIAILWYGKKGLPKLALTNFQRASYLKSELEKISGVQTFSSSFLNEFVLKLPFELRKVLPKFRENGIEPGLELTRFYPELENSLLVAVTETKNKKQLDKYIQTVRELI